MDPASRATGSDRLQPALQVAVVEDYPDIRDALIRAIESAPDCRLLGVARDVEAGLALIEPECPDILLVDLGLPNGSGRVVFRTAQALWGQRCTSAVLTVAGNEQDFMLAVRAGAKGYLFKGDQPADWLRTIRSMARGFSPLHAAQAGHLLAGLEPKPAADPEPPAAAAARQELAAMPPAALDPRTRSLLQHIAAGYTLPEIEQRLHLKAAAAGKIIRLLYDRLAEPVPNLSRRELQLLRHMNTGCTYRQCAELMGVSESTTKTQAARCYEKLGAGNLQSALYAARQAGLLP